jgi:hypothetical protein
MTCLLTGEPLRTKLGQRNVERLEKAIAHPEERTTTDAWAQKQCFYDGCAVGECAHSMVALLRYLAAKGDAASLAKARECLAVLRSGRDGNGRWKGFPFYYALLALAELDVPESRNELAYSAPACRRVLARSERGQGAAEKRRIARRAMDAAGIAIDL